MFGPSARATPHISSGGRRLLALGAFVVTTTFVPLREEAQALELRSVESAPSVRTYRMQAHVGAGESPGGYTVDVEGVYAKAPERHRIRISVREPGRDSLAMEIRRVDETLYVRSGGRWAEIEAFHLEELSVIPPEHLLDIGGRLEEIGPEELHGRRAIHLRGDKNVIPPLVSGSESIDFSQADRAVLDLWIDENDRFILKYEIEAWGMRGDPGPVTMRFEYSHINEPVTIEAPPAEETVRNEPPPMPTQSDVNEKLGFEFALPGDAMVSIYGATVSILTTMPLDEARAYAGRAMRGAGFAAGDETERAPGEFHTAYVRDGRSLGVLVFQVAERGATIQVGAVK